MPKYQSPPDMSLITSVAMTSDCQVVSYGCYNGSVRLYYPESGAIKTLGNHREKVCDMIVSNQILPGSNMEAPVVVSGSRDGDLKIWWDGGHEYNCVKMHKGAILEVRKAKMNINQA